MRMPGTKIWRAFRELDRFEDAPCDRFVRAALGSVLRRGLRMGVAIAAGVIATVLAGVGVDLAFSEELDALLLWSGAGYAVMAAIYAAMLGTGGVTTLLVRDWLLRRRIRQVLRAGATCHGCGYVLMGMPVGTDQTGRTVVRCPECELESEVDPSLSELVRDASGGARYQPDLAKIEGRRFWTPRRVRFAKRVAWITPTAVVVLALTLLGIHEIQIRMDAAQAKKDLVTQADWEKAAEEQAREDEPGEGPTVWEALEAARTKLANAELRALSLPEAREADGRPVSLRYDVLWDTSERRTEEEREQYAREMAFARAALRLLREEGVSEALDAVGMARVTTRVPPLTHLADGALVPDSTQFRDLRQMARLNAARMIAAAEAGDAPGVAGAFRANLGLGRALRAEGTHMSFLVGPAIEALAYSRVMELVQEVNDRERRVSEEIVGALAQVMDEELARRRPDSLWGEALTARAMLASSFSDPGRVRLGRFSKLAGEWVGGLDEQLKMPLGRYGENVQALHVFQEGSEELMRLSAFERPAAAHGERTELFPELLIGRALWTSGVSGTIERSIDQLRLHERATRVVLAIELYRARHGGALPADLASLGDLLGPRGVPIDTFSGRELLYRAGTRADRGMPYLVYSVGFDRVDDGGVYPALRSRFDALHAGAAGSDFVANDPR